MTVGHSSWQKNRPYCIQNEIIVLYYPHGNKWETEVMQCNGGFTKKSGKFKRKISTPNVQHAVEQEYCNNKEVKYNGRDEIPNQTKSREWQI